MVLNANTKIGAVLKHNPDALETIISISPQFEKLRNPFIRKLMAGRTTIAMAAKVGGCTISDFFTKLKSLGFEVDESIQPVTETKKDLPSFMKELKKENLVELDVRPLLAAGTDPLNIILEKVKGIKTGNTLKIINTFEPIPLIKLLEKKGYITYTDGLSSNRVETYFYKKEDSTVAINTSQLASSNTWDEALASFKEKLHTIDVRALEMPQPMITILGALDQLPPDTALYVYHKRIPVFLLPELNERKLDYRIKEISDSEVHLLIYKP